MRVLYNTCYADPWIQVAKELDNKYGYKPVYWIGYDDDNSEELIPETFPGIIYHKYFDAWKGIFPKSVSDTIQPLDIDFLKDYANFELQAIKMMDRMDPDQHSFSFSERQRHFRNFLRKWSSIIDEIKPEAVISAVVPHRVYDYALFLLCQNKNIPFISFKNTAFTGRIIPVKGIYEIESSIYSDYKNIVNKHDSITLTSSIPEDIIQGYNKVKMDYSVAEPLYMKKHRVSNKKDSSFFGVIIKFWDRVFNNKKLFFGANSYFLKGIPTYLKRRGLSIQKSRASILHHAIRKFKNNRFKNRLKKIYESRVTQPEYNDKYVFLPLHYQPEMTSNPSGDIFVDQLLCLDVLSRNIPKHYKIYVKEHKAQFYAHTEGHTSRIMEFYDDLLMFPNVKLLPLNEDVFKLISNSVAVATVTGTVGWEAMVRAKPVIIFGLSWYEGYEGVLKIKTQKDASNIYSFISNFTFSEQNLFSYLKAFSLNSVKAYYYRGLKSRINQSEKDCVESLSSTIYKLISNSVSQM